jgi:hypothetical protein
LGVGVQRLQPAQFGGEIGGGQAASDAQRPGDDLVVVEVDEGQGKPQPGFRPRQRPRSRALTVTARRLVSGRPAGGGQESGGSPGGQPFDSRPGVV